MTSRQTIRVWLQRHRATLMASLLSLSLGLAISLLAAQVLRRPPSVLPSVPPIRAPVIPATSAPILLPAPIPPEPVEAVPVAPRVIATPPALTPKRLAAWQQFAVTAAAKPPMIAVIIDDMGLDRRRSEKISVLPSPLTLSFMAYAGNLPDQALAAHALGHELMMHVPMQPLSAAFDAGPDVLTDDLPLEEVRRRIDRDLDRFTGYVGINNHMGSRFTADPARMRIVMEALHQRGLLFIDSLTTGKSVGLAEARQAGVPAASRDVFLDDVVDEAAILAQLAKAEDQAKKTGSAIAIGHPHDATINALSRWLPGLEARGITLVPVTSVVGMRLSGKKTDAKN